MLEQKKYENCFPKMNELCEGCLFEKHAVKIIFKRNMYKNKKSLKLIYSDVWMYVIRFIQTFFFCKNKYFVFFIHDFSIKFWMYFLKEKIEVFCAFNKFKTLIEKESDHNNQRNLIEEMNSH